MKIASALKNFLDKNPNENHTISEHIIIETCLTRLYHVIPVANPIIQSDHLQSYLDSTIISSNFAGKVKPPLLSLPSFNVNALILAFDGYQLDVKLLLNRLNRNSLRYLNSHNKIIQSFVNKSPH